MTNPSGNADPGVADHRGNPAAPLRTSRVRPYALDIIPIGPNVFATISSFICLVFAPWICLYTLHAVWGGAIIEDHLAGYLIPTGLRETLTNAAIGAALFLVIGAILQTWDYIRPFPSRLPTFLAFPIVWALLVPEVLLAGGSVICGAVVGAAMATAFAVHWGMLTLLREVRE